MTKRAKTDDYVNVKATVLMRSKDAFLIDCEPDASDINRTEWVPYSLIHGGDEKRIIGAAYGDKIEFRIREWKAGELALHKVD